MHLEDSHYFKDHYRNNTFEKRSEKFLEIEDKNIHIEIIVDDDIPAGYCISTIDKSAGEIDSIFIEEKYRKYKLGTKLLENSIRWLKENNCIKISVAVAEGHESVLGFYEKAGFYPRLIYLQL